MSQASESLVLSSGTSHMISPDEIEYGKRIGEGIYGTVFLGRCRGKEVAIKKLKQQQLDPETLEDLRKEIEIMTAIRHPNILLFMGACTTPGDLAIITEYVAGGNLETIIHNLQIPLTLYTRMKMAKDAALGINWLHCSNPQILHRDIKPANLLVDQTMCVKVCDFGLAAVKHHGKKLEGADETSGTPIYMSFDALVGKPVDDKSDVYSFGIVLWEIVTRKRPFTGYTSLKQFAKAVVIERVRPQIPEDVPDTLKDLMQRCWSPDPPKRPPFSDILPILDVVMIETAIPDDHGRQFWKDNFLGKETAKWSKFIQLLFKFIGHAVPDSHDYLHGCLKILLQESINDPTKEKPLKIVKLANFGNFLSWFGPLKGGKGLGIMERVTDLCDKPWFHGNISKTECEQLLSRKKGGAYLIRLSTAEQGCFTLSKLTKDRKIVHQRLHFRAGEGFTITVNNVPKTYGTLPELVKANKSDLNLKKACEGSKLAALALSSQPVCEYKDQ
eukprot:TRINITY_DN2111_c0_g2_i1.p1 TRINITY_DN2111_c0_g2~~TRINITY_DN2111_c0_g2_i1.p1  ORF type:complete len:526 (+),score=124.20 TRINITY_DN2111_c0_g2_i1:81-1580(+)